MPVIDLLISTPVERTVRVLQLEGLFDVTPMQRSESCWSVRLPIEDFDWQIGLVVGPSGSGKSTLARHAWPEALAGSFDWSENRAVVDGFPASMSIREITAALSSVGFSSPPSWLRPFRCLSTGEQFRANLARALADQRPLVVIDEFTSVVDRTVAQIGSAAVAKAVRRTPGRRLIAVTCHSDVEPWLCPDWVLEMPDGTFARRSLQRPPIRLEIVRTGPEAWNLFRRHHYLDTSLHKAARSFLALLEGRPVAFVAALHMPGQVSFWREHRCVCLPDFQGVGIGNAVSEFVAGVMRCRGKRYLSVTGNPAMTAHRARSPLWRMTRTPSRTSRDDNERVRSRLGNSSAATLRRATNRLTASFEYIGPVRPQEARALGVIGSDS